MYPNYGDGITNILDPDQTITLEQNQICSGTVS